MSRMHRISIVATALLLLCSFYPTHTLLGAQAAPIVPDIVREGDFALALVEILDLVPAASEADAESLLTSYGIVPPNGWIADYPVTPDVLRDLEMDIASAAHAGLLRISRDDAMARLAELTTELGLPSPGSPNTKHGMVPSGSEEDVTPVSSDIEDFYAQEGPPIITYIPPLYDYGYLYDWVPYSFYWFGLSFPGYYILHDFHGVRKVLIHKRHGKHAIHGKHGAYRVYSYRRVSNHVIDPETGRLTVVQPGSRIVRQVPVHGINSSDRSRFTSEEARRGAHSILRRGLFRELGIEGQRRGSTGEEPRFESMDGWGAREQRPSRPTPGAGFTDNRKDMDGRDLPSPKLRSSVPGPPLASPMQSGKGLSTGVQGRDGTKGLDRASGFGFGSGRASPSRSGALSGDSFHGGSSGSLGGAFPSSTGSSSRAGVSSGGLSGRGFSGGSAHGAGGFSGGGGHAGGGFSGGGFRGR